MVNNPINVVKRDSTREPLDIDKIHSILTWSIKGYKDCLVSEIEMNSKISLTDGVSTDDIHLTLIKSAVNLISAQVPNYKFVAGRLLNYYIRKKIFGISSDEDMPHLEDVIKDNIANNTYDSLILDFYDEEDLDQINDIIKHSNDYTFDYAGLKQCYDKYLVRNRATDVIYETPQYMYIMIAMTLYRDVDPKLRFNKIRKYYKDVSSFKISLPTPIMAGVRAPTRQYSSCTLIDCGDSLNSINSSNSAILKYVANRAGIGLNVSKIRSYGSEIRKGEAKHTGLIPFLKSIEGTVHSVSQGAVRTGAATVNYPFWNPEIENLLVLKNNRGTDENRVRNLDYCVQLSRLFYQRFLAKGKISLFSTIDCPDLITHWGDNDKWDKAYVAYEKNKSIPRKEVCAVELMNFIARERLETGRLYILNIDHVNDHSPFLEKVNMTNLCVEVTLVSRPLDSIEDGNKVTKRISYDTKDKDKVDQYIKDNESMFITLQDHLKGDY